jgi:hypothetical protein
MLYKKDQGHEESCFCLDDVQCISNVFSLTVTPPLKNVRKRRFRKTLKKRVGNLDYTRSSYDVGSLLSKHSDFDFVLNVFLRGDLSIKCFANEYIHFVMSNYCLCTKTAVAKTRLKHFPLKTLHFLNPGTTCDGLAFHPGE